MCRLLSTMFALCITAGALAQGAYPSRPITMVVGFAPSGGADTVARIIARKLSEIWDKTSCSRTGRAQVAASRLTRSPKLATTGATRSPFLPDVPTIAESGYPGYEATNWYAYMAPGRTSTEIVARLNRELVKVLETPEVRDQLFTHGMEPMPGSSEALAKYIERELAVWGKVVKEAGIRAE